MKFDSVEVALDLWWGSEKGFGPISASNAIESRGNLFIYGTWTMSIKT
ncbi:hypothetical protein GsuE55_10500 [Geobacillus subterraneus]|uniref:Uncharacterized protein n=1 Tax=Geobacillus subterraneus TaxID=129338 RepID=A0A679FPR0_9BACL|nr:hypothetical protein GsuE55_10500 [Geobacillus subterraneus]